MLAALLVMSPCAQAYSTDTVRKQALMGGLSDGVSKQQQTSANSSNGNAVPAAAGVKATGTGMQNMDAMYPQNGKPSGSTVNNAQQAAPYRPPLRQPVPLQAPPAWAQTTDPTPLVEGLLPYGASLFRGNFANTYQEGLQPQYIISPGDRIMLRAWGAFTLSLIHI